MGFGSVGEYPASRLVSSVFGGAGYTATCSFSDVTWLLLPCRPPPVRSRRGRLPDSAWREAPGELANGRIWGKVLTGSSPCGSKLGTLQGGWRKKRRNQEKLKAGRASVSNNLRFLREPGAIPRLSRGTFASCFTGVKYKNRMKNLKS